ncbi:histidine phosphatase family protein [Almyronema epifaneia]|uniref:Histidine phosphatase family protein n=1 Tax=Almyronema epifaneia S1 TaxID=2991925 RepID=A0ABW6IHU9_9CYAN
MPFLQLLFIRHAQSVANQTQQMEGQADSSLSAMGQAQARQLGSYLQSQSWNPTCIYSSPLKRAWQTAEMLRSFLPAAIPLIAKTNLQECHQGIFQGLTWTEAQKQYPQLCQQLLSTLDWLPIPQAESPEQVRQRSHVFLNHLFGQHGNGDRLWIVSHSGLLQHLIANLLGSDRSWQIAIAHTSLFEFWIDCDRWDLTDQTRYNTELWQIRRFNDCSHLQALEASPQPN